VNSSAASSREAASPASEVLLEVRGVSKSFGACAVLKNISLNIASGEFLTLLGESGFRQNHATSSGLRDSNNPAQAKSG